MGTAELYSVMESFPEVVDALAVRCEVPVKRILLGRLPDDVVSAGPLADPASLQPFVALARERASAGRPSRPAESEP
jgi:hypothetical protein